jgi:hypothetical protein
MSEAILYSGDDIPSIRKRAYSTVELLNIFDGQVQTLDMLGCPVRVIEYLEERKHEIVSKAFSLTFRDDNMPFLLVVPISEWGINLQLRALSMKMESSVGGIIEIEGKGVDIVGKSKKTEFPYVVYDVNAVYDSVAKKRKFLSLQELLAFLFQNERFLLERKRAIAIGGGSENGFSISFNADENISLERIIVGNPDDCWDVILSHS